MSFLVQKGFPMQLEQRVEIGLSGLKPYKSVLYVTLEVCKSDPEKCSNKFTTRSAVCVSGASLPARRADAQ